MSEMYHFSPLKHAYAPCEAVFRVINDTFRHHRGICMALTFFTPFFSFLRSFMLFTALGYAHFEAGQGSFFKIRYFLPVFEELVNT